MSFMNLTFLYLFPYIYGKNSKFLGREEAFGKFTIREERGEKEIRRRGKMLFY
jgi:hypothetical protein